MIDFNKKSKSTGNGWNKNPLFTGYPDSQIPLFQGGIRFYARVHLKQEMLLFNL
jgi:hypothetical protein